ncbi:hypothetical protein EGW08_009045 [Elysia chlorotica]|uniref:Uncharacterized protein n=1 Tax=Elysia chlorotica TaxID=188477 RepID=A0A3S0ZUK4_ELYCH|nr:hypothetical protein EGW08_009045 [Elysia chlorotica]
MSTVKETSKARLDCTSTSGDLEGSSNELPAKKLRKLMDLKKVSHSSQKGKANKCQSSKLETSVGTAVGNKNNEKMKTFKKEHSKTSKFYEIEEKGSGSSSSKDISAENMEAINIDLEHTKELKKLITDSGYHCNEEVKLIEIDSYPQHKIALTVTAGNEKGKRNEQSDRFKNSKSKEKFSARDSTSLGNEKKHSDSKSLSKTPSGDTKRSISSCREDHAKSSSTPKTVKTETKEDNLKHQNCSDFSHYKDKSQSSQSSLCKGNKRYAAVDISHQSKNKSSSTRAKERKGDPSLSPVVKVENMQTLKYERSSRQPTMKDTHKTKERREGSHKHKQTAKDPPLVSSRSSSRSRSRHTSPGPPQLERAVSPPRSRTKVKKESSEGFLELFSVKEELLVVSEAKDSSKKTISMYGRSSREKKNVEESDNNQDKQKLPCQESKWKDSKEKQEKRYESDWSYYKKGSSSKSYEKKTSASRQQSNKDKKFDQDNIDKLKKAKTTTNVDSCVTNHKSNHSTSSDKSHSSIKRSDKDADTKRHDNKKSKSQTSSKTISYEKERISKTQFKVEDASEVEHKSQSGEKMQCIKDNQEDIENIDLDAHMDSPDAMLTPVSLSQFNQEDEDAAGSRSPDQCILQNSQQGIASLLSSPVSLATNCDSVDGSFQSNSSSGKKPETSCALDLEPFPFPPTPQKTPMPTSPSSCAVSTTSSPCSVIPASPSTSVVIIKSCVTDHSPDSSGEIEKCEHVAAALEPKSDPDGSEKSKPDTTTDESCPQPDNVDEEKDEVKNDLSQDLTSEKNSQAQAKMSISSCSSPLFPQKSTVSGKRACGRSSSTSSKCSSDEDDDDDDEDSSSATSISSSSSGSSSDDGHSYGGSGKKRKRKSKKSLCNSSGQRKTPPKKLSLLHPPLALSIGSPTKAPVQYSPMPSPSVNGFSSYVGPMRLGLGGASVSGVLAGKSSSLTPLSISVQHSPGYQMVSADSMRSPNGVMRSPVGACSNVSGSVVLTQYSTFPGPASLSPTVGPSSLVPAPKLSPQLSFKKDHVLDNASELEGKLFGTKTSNSVCSENQTYASNSHQTECESKSEKLAVKDFNANNSEKPHYHTTRSRDVTTHTLELKGDLKSQIQIGELSSSKSSNQLWQENSFPNTSMPCFVAKEVNERNFAQEPIPAKPQMLNLNKTACTQESRLVEPSLLPIKNQDSRISQSFGKPLCVYTNVSQSVEGKDALPKHARQVESQAQFELPQQQLHAQQQHQKRDGFHQPRSMRTPRSGGCSGLPPSSQQMPGSWGQQQQHPVSMPVGMFRGRHSRFGGLTKPRVQSSSGYFHPGEHSRQHYNHYRGPAYTHSAASGALTPATPSPPPLLSPMDQPYGSDWWILVMNNQAGSTPSAQLGGTMLNGQPQ